MYQHSFAAVICTYCSLTNSLISALQHYPKTLICDEGLVRTYGRAEADETRE